MKRVVILGAGFGGLELATRLSEEVADEVHVTLIDQSDHFVFGFAKLDVMVGNKAPEAVRLHYKDIVKPSVKFKQERVEAIDARSRVVTTSEESYEADVLVVALGADYDIAATPGLAEGGHEFYTLEGAKRLHDDLPDFKGGEVVIAVLGPFYKCPPAPYEAGMLLHDYLKKRDLAEQVSIKVLSPMSMPIPISTDISEGILAGLAERGIEFWSDSKVPRIDPETKTAHLENGRELSYDLFLGIPRHRAPAVVESSGLAVDGWIPVDTRTFATSFPGVYAIGDVTSAPVPRAGVFAEGEAATLADHLIAQIRDEGETEGYGGVAACYVEFGGGLVGRADVDFLTAPQPHGTFQAPSLDITREKANFGATRAKRWFGH
ncbi:MAG TPA: FAD-dependent oxidoreductase [Actinomycetota bacterium]|nr:FAD-dependent oxidoreductase [Actinomycetota bacterium]